LKTILINGNSYSIPKSWDQVSIEQQLTVERLTIEQPELKSMAVIAGYTNSKIEQIKHLHLNDVKLLLNELSFIGEPIPVIPTTDFEHRGNKYSILKTLLKSEFQDFLTIETLLDNHKGKEYQALPFIIAVLAKKEGESLSDYDLESRSKEFLDLPITIANNIYLFFCTIGKISSIDSHKILKEMDQDLNVSMNYMINMVRKLNGGQWSIRLLRVLLLIYLKSLKKNWKAYYSGYNLKTEKQNWIKQLIKWLKKKLKNG
jgi:hypothetical protein